MPGVLLPGPRGRGAPRPRHHHQRRAARLDPGHGRQLLAPGRHLPHRPDADPDAVVDPQLRVRGITGLRVADASVMPVIPNDPLNGTVLAIAEKAASLITGRD